jgi:hypothetical protein
MYSSKTSGHLILLIVMLSSVLQAQWADKPKPGNMPFTRFLTLERTEIECVAFGEKLKCYKNLEDNVTWEIRDKVTNTLIYSGSGNTLMDYVFNDPGNYIINLDQHLNNNPNSCDHGTLPDIIDLMVSPVRMTYKCNEITFSSPIVVGVQTNGIILTVNVNVALNGISDYNFNVPQARTSGTDTEIVATPVQTQITLTPGINQLQYVLSGKVNRPSYVIFDFIDSNGKIQDYTYTILVN